MFSCKIRSKVADLKKESFVEKQKVTEGTGVTRENTGTKAKQGKQRVIRGPNGSRGNKGEKG